MNAGLKSVFVAIDRETEKMDKATKQRLEKTLGGFDELAAMIDVMKAKIKEKRANVERLMAEFLQIEKVELDKAEKELSTGAVTEADVRAKRATMAAFFERGVSADLIAQRAAAMTAERTESLSAIIRADKLELLELETELARLDSELAQKRVSIPTIRTQVLSEFSGEISRNLSHLWHEARVADEEYRVARGRLKAAQGKAFGGKLQFDGLNVEKLKMLFTEPGLEKCRPALAEVLEYAKNKKDLGAFSVSLDLYSGRVEWLLAAPIGKSGVMLKHIEISDDDRKKTRRA